MQSFPVSLCAWGILEVLQHLPGAPGNVQTSPGSSVPSQTPRLLLFSLPHFTVGGEVSVRQMSPPHSLPPTIPAGTEAQLGFSVFSNLLGSLISASRGLGPWRGRGRSSNLLRKLTPVLLADRMSSDQGRMTTARAEKLLFHHHIFPTSILYGINVSFDTKI